MKVKIYRKRLTTLALMLSITTIAIIGCGNKSAATGVESEATTTETETADKPSDTQFQLKGKLVKEEGEANELIVLQRLEDGRLTFVDSVRTDDKGKYEFNASADKPTFFYVTINSMEPPGVPILLENNKSLELDLEVGQFIETNIKGDNQNVDLKKLYDLYLGHNKASYEFQKRFSSINPAEATDSLKLAFNKEYASLQSQMTSDVLSFVQTNKGGASTYFAATYVVPKPSPDLLNSALEKMKKDAPESGFTQKLETRINSISALDIGGLAPEITLASPTGEMVSLSSLRGKVVLIDFWASWCRPCRQENPNVVRVYNKYHDKGFEVFSVSLDNDAMRWKAAIQQDGLTWTHVSDLKGWSSSAAGLYKVTGIPKTFLLDKNGRIIAKDLRGPQLELKLEEIFN